MLKKILSDLKYIISNDGGWYVAAAMAVLSILGSSSDKKKQDKALVADGKMQATLLKRARGRAADDSIANQRKAIQAAQRRDISIERSSLMAKSKLDETFAGSGISGDSIDELDSELNAAVAQNKYENKIALDESINSIERTRSNTEEDIAAKGTNIGKGASSTSILELAQTGLQGYQAGMGLESSLKQSKIDDANLAKAEQEEAASRQGNSSSVPSPSLGLTNFRNNINRTS